MTRLKPRQSRLLSRLQIAVLGVAVLSLGVPTWAQSPKDILAAAESARLDNEVKLTSAIGSGTLHVSHFDQGAIEPLDIAEASLQVCYDASKFYVRIRNHLRLQEIPMNRRTTREKWVESDIAETLVLFDGDALYSVQWKRDGSCQGEVYFAFSRQAVLRAAGFPFEHPVHIWKEALNISRIRPERTKITPLIGGGFMAVESMNSYDTKFIVLDEFGYDLRRVITQRSDNGLPIREFSIVWGKSEGVHFVKRLSNAVSQSSSVNALDEMQIESKVTVQIEYDDFEVNVPIPAEAFQIAQAGIPSGTRFVDKRSRTSHNEASLVFDGQRLEQAE